MTCTNSARWAVLTARIYGSGVAVRVIFSVIRETRHNVSLTSDTSKYLAASCFCASAVA